MQLLVAGSTPRRWTAQTHLLPATCTLAKRIREGTPSDASSCWLAGTSGSVSRPTLCGTTHLIHGLGSSEEPPTKHSHAPFLLLRTALLHTAGKAALTGHARQLMIKTLHTRQQQKHTQAHDTRQTVRHTEGAVTHVPHMLRTGQAARQVETLKVSRNPCKLQVRLTLHPAPPVSYDNAASATICHHSPLGNDNKCQHAASLAQIHNWHSLSM
ncbi:hypothetical protein COO60DRAFT_352649 [Scenedesmus sp. NREL 46B-D3]|nr:hypothetical protein COO60DRAFT_352649 [Scenedesmus sp. NREL 46B-D3]